MFGRGRRGETLEKSSILERNCFIIYAQVMDAKREEDKISSVLSMPALCICLRVRF